MENSGIFKSMKHSDHLIVTEWDFSYIVLKEVEWILVEWNKAISNLRLSRTFVGLGSGLTKGNQVFKLYAQVNWGEGTDM